VRPKKTILLHCSDEVRCSLIRFVLQNAGYNVMACVSGLPPLPDVALFIDDAMLGTEDLAHHVHPEVPLLVLLRKDRRGVNYPARAFLIPHPIDNAELLERIKLAVQRKSGPKKRLPQLQEATA
jgi:hypothetical protein